METVEVGAVWSNLGKA